MKTIIIAVITVLLFMGCKPTTTTESQVETSVVDSTVVDTTVVITDTIE